MQRGWTAEEQQDYQRWLAQLETCEELIDDVDAYHDLVYDPADFDCQPPRRTRFVLRAGRFLRRLRELPGEIRGQ